jgi:hypothetical protein
MLDLVPYRCCGKLGFCAIFRQIARLSCLLSMLRCANLICSSWEYIIATGRAKHLSTGVGSGCVATAGAHFQIPVNIANR